MVITIRCLSGCEENDGVVDVKDNLVEDVDVVGLFLVDALNETTGFVAKLNETGSNHITELLLLLNIPISPRQKIDTHGT